VSRDLYIYSIKLEVGPGSAQGTADISFDTEVELHGIILFPQDPAYEDTINLEVVHPQLGVLSSYSNGAHLGNKTDKIEIMIDSRESQALMPPGLILRSTYLAIDTSGRHCIVWFRLRK
jgi:hypothetical protein